MATRTPTITDLCGLDSLNHRFNFGAVVFSSGLPCNVQQILKRINPCRMPVPPYRLNRIISHVHDAGQLKGSRGKRMRRRLVQISHHILLPLAAGAWAMSAQLFQRHKSFTAILPPDGEFVPDCLHIQRPHDLKITSPAMQRPHSKGSVAGQARDVSSLGTRRPALGCQGPSAQPPGGALAASSTGMRFAIKTSCTYDGRANRANSTARPIRARHSFFHTL